VTRISSPRVFSDCSESERVRGEITRDVTQYLINQFGVQPLGYVPEFPATSCSEIEQTHRQPSTGLYWIAQRGLAPIQIFCNFEE